MIRIAEKQDIPAILAIYGPYILTSTATFEYDVPTEAEFYSALRPSPHSFRGLFGKKTAISSAMPMLPRLTAVRLTNGAPSLLCICIRMLVAKASEKHSMPRWNPS